MPLTFFIKGFEFAHMQPLTPKFGGQTAHPGVLQHPPGLCHEHFGFVQPATAGEGAQFLIR